MVHTALICNLRCNLMPNHVEICSDSKMIYSLFFERQEPVQRFEHWTNVIVLFHCLTVFSMHCSCLTDCLESPLNNSVLWSNLLEKDKYKLDRVETIILNLSNVFRRYNTTDVVDC